jgi:hypothetical protein
VAGSYPLPLPRGRHTSWAHSSVFILQDVLMRITAAIALAFAVPAAASAADTLDIKEGLWEATSTVMIEGLQLPPGLLQSLPEDQRAQLERMDGQPRADRVCVTRKDIAEAFERFDRQSACTRDRTVSTPRVLEANMTCTGFLAGTGIARVEAPTPTRVQGSAVLRGLLGNMSATLQARWLSAACGDVKS